MITSTLSLFALVALTAAQNSTTSLLLPPMPEISLVGSIAGSNSAATTYVVQCAPTSSGASPNATADSSSPVGGFDNALSAGDCPYTTPFTVVEGPSTFSFAFAPDGVSVTFACQITGTTQTVCSGMGGDAGMSGSDTMAQAVTVGPNDLTAYPVVITASATSGGNSKSGSGSGSGSAPASTGSSSSSGSSSGAASKQTTAGGMHVESGLGLGIAGMLAVGLAAVVL